jgi:hypothetical protein
LLGSRKQGISVVPAAFAVDWSGSAPGTLPEAVAVLEGHDAKVIGGMGDAAAAILAKVLSKQPRGPFPHKLRLLMKAITLFENWRPASEVNE